MSESLGPVTFGKADEKIFLGKDMSKHTDYSNETAVLIDREIKNIVNSCWDKSKKLLEDNLEILHELARVLLEKEVVDSKELNNLVLKYKPDFADAAA